METSNKNNSQQIQNNTTQKNNKSKVMQNKTQPQETIEEKKPIIPSGAITSWTDKQLSETAEQLKEVIQNEESKLEEFNRKSTINDIEQQLEDEYNSKNNVILDTIIKIITLGIIDKKDNYIEEKKDMYIKKIKNNLEKKNTGIIKQVEPFKQKLNEINLEKSKRQQQQKIIAKENAERQEYEQMILKSALDKMAQLKNRKFEEEITDLDIRNTLTSEELQQYRKYQEIQAEEERQKIIKENKALDEQIKFEEKKAQINEKRKKLEQMQQQRLNETTKKTPTLTTTNSKEEQFNKRQELNKKIEQSFLQKYKNKKGLEILSLKEINSIKNGIDKSC